MTMTATYSTDAKDTIRQFVRRSIRGAAFEDDTDLFESGIVNSLFAVQMMTFIEKEFGIEVGMEDLDIEHFKSLNATAAFVQSKLNGRAGG